MSKQELIDRIRNFNRGAHQEFLEDFSVHDLAEYLHHLEDVFQPRVMASRFASVFTPESGEPLLV